MSSSPPAITVRGAVRGTLRETDIDVPLGTLVCFVGRCGSGARTMAFDVLYAESRRRYMLALSPSERSHAGGVARVSADEISGLPPAIQLGRVNREPGSMAEFLELDGPMGRLWHQRGDYRCPECAGRCRSYTDEEAAEAVVAQMAGFRCLILAPMEWPRQLDAEALLGEIRRAGFLRVRQNGELIRLEKGVTLSPKDDFEVVVDRLVPGPESRNRVIEGVRNARKVAGGRSLIEGAEGEARLVANRSLSCQECGRSYPVVTPEQLAVGRQRGGIAARVSIDGLAASQLGAATVAELGQFCSRLDVEADLVGGIVRTVECATRLRLEYLPLATDVESLSTGEHGRLLVARCLTSGLSGMLYVFDAPTAGLTGDELDAQVEGIQQLVAMGNTVICVDHSQRLLGRSDRIYSFDRGGVEPVGAPIVQSTASTPDVERGPDHRAPDRDMHHDPDDYLEIHITSHPVIEPARTRIPLHRLVAVTGRSGSGKSLLLREVIAPFIGSGNRGPNRSSGEIRCRLVGASRIRRVVDLGGLGEGPDGRRSPRTLAAELETSKAMAKLLAETPAARSRSYPPEWFLLEVPGGRCATCEGRGTLSYDLEFLEDLSLTCSACEGKRYQREVLEITYRGYNASDILDLPVRQAVELFSRESGLRSKFAAAEVCGLGECALGTGSTELEPDQYLWARLSTVMVGAAATDLLLLDEPAAGSHPLDVELLVDILQRLVRKGVTVVVSGQCAWLPAADWELRMDRSEVSVGGAITYSGPPNG